MFVSLFIRLSFLSCCIQGFIVSQQTRHRKRNEYLTFSFLKKLFTTKRGNENEIKCSPSETSIAIVGSGAVGCYYGARLWESNYDVSFLARGEHYQACIEDGLNVTVKIENITFFLQIAFLYLDIVLT